ncbi:MAG: 50S ribosomal protein L23, partial [Parcubacteria group bacterium]
MINLNLKNNNVLKKPRITEKAAIGADRQNVYVFEVVEEATKGSVSASVKSMYKVVPEKVRIARNPARNVIVRGRRGVKSGIKKAYVYL